MKVLEKYIMTLVAGLCCLLASSCIDDRYGPCPGTGDSPDAELRLSVRFDLGPSTKVGDPGEDHGEFVADWHSLGIYLLYDSGRILDFIFTKENFPSENRKVFNVFEGRAEVLVVAFPAGQEAPAGLTADEVRNMKTKNVTTVAASERKNYMRNIFSGTGEIDIKLDANNMLDVVCSRVAAKVDMQYDVQDGIDGGVFLKAAMSEISFSGVPQAYIFPGKVSETQSLPAVTEVMAIADAAVSERNGRAYSYMFPGDASIAFGVNYTKPDGSLSVVNYKAGFTEALSGNVWYKVNFNVTGKNVDATEGINIELKDSNI